MNNPKKVPLRELKQKLSFYVSLAQKGQPIEITKFNQSVALLTQSTPSSVHIGSRVGTGRLKNVLSVSSEILNKVLAADREDD